MKTAKHPQRFPGISSPGTFQSWGLIKSHAQATPAGNQGAGSQRDTYLSHQPVPSLIFQEGPITLCLFSFLERTSLLRPAGRGVIGICFSCWKSVLCSALRTHHEPPSTSWFLFVAVTASGLWTHRLHRISLIVLGSHLSPSLQLSLAHFFCFQPSSTRRQVPCLSIVLVCFVLSI